MANGKWISSISNFDGAIMNLRFVCEMATRKTSTGVGAPMWCHIVVTDRVHILIKRKKGIKGFAGNDDGWHGACVLFMYFHVETGPKPQKLLQKFVCGMARRQSEWERERIGESKGNPAAIRNICWLNVNYLNQKRIPVQTAGKQDTRLFCWCKKKKKKRIEKETKKKIKSRSQRF